MQSFCNLKRLAGGSHGRRMGSEESSHAHENVGTERRSCKTLILDDTGFVDLKGMKASVFPEKCVP